MATRGKTKKNHCIFSSQLRADQMPGSPREGQLMCTLVSKHASINTSWPPGLGRTDLTLPSSSPTWAQACALAVSHRNVKEMTSCA